MTEHQADELLSQLKAITEQLTRIADVITSGAVVTTELANAGSPGATAAFAAERLAALGERALARRRLD